MNKVFYVNIGGIPFTIDEDAYAILEDYLNTIELHFSGEEGYEEIVADIENRIGELVRENLGQRKIVEAKDIESAVKTMGTPEDFANEGETQEDPTSKQEHKKGDSKNSDYKFQTGKRLYKNPDDKVISGVASGLAAYFGVKDPVWIRLLFALLVIFGGGSGIPIYIVLVFILKDAKTPKEKLEMRGEPINLENLNKFFQTEMKEFGEQFKDFTGKTGSKKKAKDSSWDSSEFEFQAKKVANRLGETIEHAIKGLFKIISPLFMLIGGILIAALVVGWVAIIFSLLKGKPVIMMLMPTNPAITILGGINIVFIVLLPIIGLIILLIRWIFKVKFQGSVGVGLFGFWILNVFSVSVVGTQIVEEYKTPFTVIENLIKKPEESAKIYFGAIKTSKNEKFTIGKFSFGDGNLTIDPTIVYLEKSEDEHFHVIAERTSRGKDEAEAKQLAQAIPLETYISNDTLRVIDRIKIPYNTKYRSQQVSLRLLLPESKPVLFDQDLGQLVFRSRIPGKAIDQRMIRGKTVVLTSEGLEIKEEE